MNKQLEDKLASAKREAVTVTKQRDELKERVRILEKRCLELQHENAEHRSMYRSLFRTLQEAQKWQT